MDRNELEVAPGLLRELSEIPCVKASGRAAVEKAAGRVIEGTGGEKEKRPGDPCVL